MEHLSTYAEANKANVYIRFAHLLLYFRISRISGLSNFCIFPSSPYIRSGTSIPNRFIPSDMIRAVAFERCNLKFLMDSTAALRMDSS